MVAHHACSTISEFINVVSLETSFDQHTNSVISFLGSIAIATSLGEIASIYPTAGGISDYFPFPFK
jgi:hypothetical protein